MTEQLLYDSDFVKVIDKGEQIFLSDGCHLYPEGLLFSKAQWRALCFASLPEVLPLLREIFDAGKEQQLYDWWQKRSYQLDEILGLEFSRD